MDLYSALTARNKKTVNFGEKLTISVTILFLIRFVEVIHQESSFVEPYQVKTYS